MSLLDDLQEDRDTQIKAACIAFFLIAFPVYFSMASSLKDVGSLGGSSGPVGNYSVEGTYSYHAIGDDIVYVEDGTTVNISANSDAGDVDGLNIVAVRVTMNNTDDETASGLTCTFPPPSQDDDVTGMIMKEEFTGSATGTGTTEVIAEWHNSSIIGSNVSGFSEDEISTMLEGGTIGFGEYSLDISVVVNKAQRPGCNPADDGEEVEYIIELVSLEYTITPVE
jgi:hypothetical protein